MNFEVENSTTYNYVSCEERSGKTITPAKAILEDMDAILKELGNELRQIEDAIYSPSNDGCDANEQKDNSLLQTLGRQRNLAENLLKTAAHIRDGLW